MENNDKNLYPIFHKIAQRSDKERLLRQRSKVIWLIGLSGSGKSSISIEFEKALYKRGYLTQILDGDNIRSGINNNLGFSVEDRVENIRRVSEVSKLFLNAGIIIINCFITPTREIRKMARDIIGEDDFLEVYVNAPIEVCEERDTKGLYKKARQGIIKNFTGIDSPFEPPVNPVLELKTHEQSMETSVDQLLKVIGPHITYKETSEAKVKE
ncbi:MAG: adenylyl-sulfate kinase [Bacteroidales bacterium]|nr:adenylyl-sulfate kinase [Bacteroidales bacterium]